MYCETCGHDRGWHGAPGGQPARPGQTQTCCYYGVCNCAEYVPHTTAPEEEKES
jgi:hypothetical protein